jgi:hypothetical protein
MVGDANRLAGGRAPVPLWLLVLLVAAFAVVVLSAVAGFDATSAS